MLKRFLNWLGIQNRYEAGRRWQKDRTYLHGWVQDPRFDADQATRLELVRKSRWFEKNDALAQGLAEVFTEFTVGAYGPIITPASSDDEWNQRVSEYLSEWYSLADMVTRQGYAGIMTTAAWRRFFDGEFFILKTGSSGKPRLQGIASHRVATPADKIDQEGRTIIDGVVIDSRGRPTGYWINTSTDDRENFELRPADQVIHIFEPESPGQYRGLPMLTPVMNDLHDLADLFMLEMAAAKVQSKDAIVIKNQSGALNRDKLHRQRLLPNLAPATAENPDESKARQLYYQKAFPGRTIAAYVGDEVQMLASNRPSVTTQWFFDYLAQRVCMGVGISKMLVLPWSIQGTIGRGEYERSRNYFLSRFVPFASAVQQIYWYVIGTARFSDPRIADAPMDWTRVTIRPPRTVNVDAGRNSAATIADLESGLTTIEEQYSMRGLDWREQLRQRAKEEKFIDQLAKEEGLDPSRIRRAITDSLKAGMQTERESREREELEAAQ